MGVKLTIKDKKLAHKKSVQRWLRECEKDIKAAIQDIHINLLTTGYCEIGTRKFRLDNNYRVSEIT